MKNQYTIECDICLITFSGTLEKAMKLLTKHKKNHEAANK